MRTSRALALTATMLLALGLAACRSDSPATTAKAGSDATTTSTTAMAHETTASDGKTTTTSGGAAVSGMTISIKDFAFHPASLKVSVGDTVTVTNDDGTTHTWAADDMSIWDSGDLAPGKTFKRTFDKAGTFAYHCHIHQTMKGTVVVS